MVIRAVSSRRDRLDRIRLTPQNEAGWANAQLASTFLTPTGYERLEGSRFRLLYLGAPV